MFVAVTAVVIAGPVSAVCGPSPHATDEQLTGAINWACSDGGVNCLPIQPGGDRYIPNTPRDHAAYVFNAYFWAHNTDAVSCDFGGAAELSCPSPPISTLPFVIRGVNLGGWLVLEPWITPSMFAQFANKTPAATAVDEWGFAAILGAEEARRQLEAHWAGWVTDAKLARIAAAGLNTVRVPVGWWAAFDDGSAAPYVGGQLAHLDWLVAAAAGHGLKVIIDLHGAPGSQNGFDNSGLTCGPCAGVCPPTPTWATNATAIERTLAALEVLARRYAAAPAVLGLELLNEPRWDVDPTMLRAFVLNATARIRAVPGGNTTWIFVHDSFRYNLWTWLPIANLPNVALDTHVYQAFTPDDVSHPPAVHIEEACGYRHMVEFMHCMSAPTITGEWSLATTDCVEWLNGFEKPPSTAIATNQSCDPARTNGTASDEFLQQYAASQLNTWEQAGGWVFWNFDVELTGRPAGRERDAAMWSWFAAMDHGWVPANVSAGLPPIAKQACSTFPRDASPLLGGRPRASARY